MGIITNSILRVANRPGAAKPEYRLDMPQAVWGEIMNGTSFREHLIEGKWAQKAAALSTDVATSYKAINDLFMPNVPVPEIDDHHAEILAEFNRLCPVVWKKALNRFPALRENPMISDQELTDIYCHQLDGRQVPLIWILYHGVGEAEPSVGLNLYLDCDVTVWPTWPGTEEFTEA